MNNNISWTVKLHTKWEILEARRDRYLAEAAEVQRTLDDLENTNCGATCPGCNEYLRTEKDYAQHFTIPDTRYLNLGSCPNRS